MNGINVAHLQYFLSGGPSNMAPGFSLGGEISDERIAVQSGAGLYTLTGVTIDYMAGNTEGEGLLSYNGTTKAFTWLPPGGTVGTAVTVSEDGLYAVSGLNGAGLICLNVDFSALPLSNEADFITVSNIPDQLFDDVSKADSFNGDIEYRCYYIKNVHDTDSFLDIVLFMGQQPTPGSVAFGKDPNGPGDGLAYGAAVTVANENTAPLGVSFSTNNSEPGGVSVGELAPGECIGVWLRRTVTARNTTSNSGSATVADAQVYF